MQSRSSDNCAHVYNIRILNLFDTEFQLISTKLTIIKQCIKVFNRVKKYFLIIKTFIQSVMTKIKNSVSEDWIVKTIVENGLNIFSC